MKGNITVYTLTGCPHCLHSKQTLRENGLQFHEVLVDIHPEVKDFLKETTGKTSLPQIFFNGSHIGGNDSLQALKADQPKWDAYMIDLEMNEMKVSLMQPNTSSSPKSEVGEPFTCEGDPHGDLMSEFLEKGFAESFRPTFFGKKYNSCFTGWNFVDWYAITRAVDDASAINVGNELLNKKFILNLTSDSQLMEKDSKLYFRVNNGSDSTALNAGTPQYCKMESASMLSKHLRKLTLQMFDQFISADGKKVDYVTMKDSSIFSSYSDLAKELQLVSTDHLNENERKAFFINIYNALVIHSTIVNGAPNSIFSRYKFFSSTKYSIGGHEYSLDDIENGVLRGNKRALSGFCVPFSSSDPRKPISLSKVDPRIHFALNCGAKSCPPIKTFSAEEIDTELEAATEAFLEGDEAVYVSEKDTVYLSSLMKWYASDFGCTPKEVVEWVHSHIAVSKKKDDLHNALANHKINIKYISYDWGSNSL